MTAGDALSRGGGKKEPCVLGRHQLGVPLATRHALSGHQCAVLVDPVDEDVNSRIEVGHLQVLAGRPPCLIEIIIMNLIIA